MWLQAVEETRDWNKQVLIAMDEEQKEKLTLWFPLVSLISHPL